MIGRMLVSGSSLMRLTGMGENSVERRRDVSLVYVVYVASVTISAESTVAADARMHWANGGGYTPWSLHWEEADDDDEDDDDDNDDRIAADMVIVVLVIFGVRVCVCVCVQDAPVSCSDGDPCTNDCDAAAAAACRLHSDITRLLLCAPGSLSPDRMLTRKQQQETCLGACVLSDRACVYAC